MAIVVDDEVLETRYTVIATGAKPRKLNIPGEEYITTSDQFLGVAFPSVHVSQHRP